MCTKTGIPSRSLSFRFFFSIVFLVLILLSMLILLAGGYIVQLLIGIFPQIEGFQWLINLLRFTILILPIWGVLILLYRFTPNRKPAFFQRPARVQCSARSLGW